MDSEKEDLIEFIEQCRFFSILSKDKIVSLLSQFEKIKLNAGDTLFYQGDTSDHLYILIKGELISYLTKVSGNTVLVATISPVETIGELGALSGEPRSLTIEAVIDAYLLKLPSSVFREICEECPAVLAEVSQLIVQRSLETIKLIAHEKFTYNVSIVVPLTKMISHNAIKSRFEQHLLNYNTVFLCCDEIQPDEIKKIIKKSEDEKMQIIIFMPVWKEEIYKYCLQKLNHLYFLVGGREYSKAQDGMQDILKHIMQPDLLRVELIIMHADETKHIMNTRAWLELANFNLHHHVRLNSDDDFARLARFMTGNAISLVLGGGGARGYVHLGVLKALLEKEIPIDAIGGSSVGANIGACFAMTRNLALTMSYVHSIRRAGIKSLKLINLTWPLVSLFSSNPVTKELMIVFKNLCIEDLWIPYFAISANLTDKMQNVHRSGLLWEAIRSSAALPGLFPPFVSNGKLLFDGGLLNNLPVDVMRDFIGSGHVITAASLSHKAIEREPYYFPPVLTRKQTILARLGWGHNDYCFPYFSEMFLDALLLGSSAQEEKNCSAADILIKPMLKGFKTLSKNPQKFDILIEMGYKETLDAIEKFLQLHPHYRRN